MTPEEIINCDESCKSEKGWLKEIAYQLACLSQPKTIPGTAIIGEDFIKKVATVNDGFPPVKRGPGRPPKNS